MPQTRKQNKPESFAKNNFNKGKHPSSDADCALGVHTASNQRNEKNYEFYRGYKNHILVDCISGLPLYELTTPANQADASVAENILSETNKMLPLKECTFIADNCYDTIAIYSLVMVVYCGDAIIPLNKRGTKDPKQLPCGNVLCDAGLVMHRDGKTSDGHGGFRQKFRCPFRQPKTGQCPCNHRNWNSGKKDRGCTKYRAIPNSYRLSIDRNCPQFKRIYAPRTECEHYNSRFKSTGQGRLWIHNGNSAANLNAPSHVSALSVALAAVSFHSAYPYRCTKALRRAVKLHNSCKSQCSCKSASVCVACFAARSVTIFLR